MFTINRILPLLSAFAIWCPVWPVAWAQECTNQSKCTHVDHTKNTCRKSYEQKKLAASSPYDQTNPLKLLMVLLLRAYQVFLSSQDGPTCQFRPTCSHFGAQSIKQYGPVQGLLMTSDRILRCHPFTRGKYPLTPDNRHHHDPLDQHVLFEKENQ